MKPYKCFFFFAIVAVTSVFSCDTATNQSICIHSPLIEYQRVNKLREADLPSITPAKKIGRTQKSPLTISKGLTMLGNHCSLIEKIASSEAGSYQLQTIDKAPLGSENPILGLVAEKSLNTVVHLAEIPTKTKKSSIAKHKTMRILYLDGNQLENEKLIFQSLQFAKEAGIKVALNLNNHVSVRKHKDFLLNILPKFVNIVFANAKEAYELTSLMPADACDFLSTLCEMAVVTMGEKGCWAKQGSVKYYSPALKVSAVDISGVGDFFASGFLSAYLDEEPLQKCAWKGAFVASHMVQTAGDISAEKWKEIIDGL